MEGCCIEAVNKYNDGVCDGNEGGWDSFTNKPCAYCGLYWTSREQWVESQCFLLCYNASCYTNDEDVEAFTKYAQSTWPLP